MDSANQAVKEVDAILGAAAALCGSRKAAVTWFIEHQIADFGGATPRELYAMGKTRVVLDYIAAAKAQPAGTNG